MHVKMKRTSKPEDTTLGFSIHFYFQPCSFGKAKEVYDFYYVFNRYAVFGPASGS